MKGLLRHRLLIHSERARKLVGDLLVDGDDVDVSVKERITEDDTADTTLVFENIEVLCEQLPIPSHCKLLTEARETA